MDKKGDMATILLPIVAIVMSIATLLTFISFGSLFNSQAVERSELVSQVLFTQEYAVASAKLITLETVSSGSVNKEKFQEIADKKNIRMEGTDSFFGKISRNEFIFEPKAEGYVFRMDGWTIFVERGLNNIKRTVNLCLEFDNKGQYTKNC